MNTPHQDPTTLARMACWIGSALLPIASLQAQAPLTYSQWFPVNVAVPDNDDNGLLRTGMVTASGISQIADVIVWLEVRGGYNGDLYVTLSHQSGFAVLLNRVGRRDGSSTGYADSGFDATFRFEEEAPNGDVHNYRLTLEGGHNIPIGGALGGAWQPDGRAASPLDVVETDFRTATLAGFNGLGADGEWTVFFADVEAMGESTVVGWGLDIVAVVPEPTGWAMGLSLGLTGWAVWRRRAGAGWVHRDEVAKT